jgi:predicted ATP-dependent endonuclease of OLD family
MTLCALHRKSTPQRILLLDEPGQNLGPAERRILRKVLKNRLKGTQCLIITHHVEMMNNKMLKSPNAVVQARQYLGKLVYQTVILDRFPNRAWLEYLFAWGIVIVEGATDNAVLKIILEDHEVTKRQSWLIHPSAGHDKAEEFKKFCSRCHIPCVTLLDSDTLFSGQPDPYAGVSM